MQFPFNRINKFLQSSDISEGIFSVWGDIGVGKTTFSIQTAVNSALKGNRVIFIYTKYCFPFEKLDIFIQNNNQKLLDNIVFIHSIDFNDLFNLIFQLEFIILNDLRTHKVAMIIIDSITDLYRLELNRDKKEKNFILNYKLNYLLANLSYLNKEYAINILVVNNSSRKSENGQIVEIQSGGKVMEYWTRVTIKIARLESLNNRKIFFKDVDKNETIEVNSALTTKGFEEIF